MNDAGFWDAFMKTALGTGIGGAFLAFAVWWLQKNNAALLMELKNERDGKIKLLEAESQSCKADRVELHKQVSNLYLQIIDIHRTRWAARNAPDTPPLLGTPPLATEL